VLLYGSHVSSLSTDSALLAVAATVAAAVADERVDDDAMYKIVTDPLGIDVSAALLLDVKENSELLPDPPPASPVYSGGLDLVYVGRGLIQISQWTLSGVYNSVAGTPFGFAVPGPWFKRLIHCG